MLDTPPQDKLQKHLHIFNACEHSFIMMITVGSKMSKTKYDLKTIMYHARDWHLWNKQSFMCHNCFYYITVPSPEETVGESNAVWVQRKRTYILDSSFCLSQRLQANLSLLHKWWALVPLVICRATLMRQCSNYRYPWWKSPKQNMYMTVITSSEQWRLCFISVC